MHSLRAFFVATALMHDCGDLETARIMVGNEAE